MTARLAVVTYVGLMALLALTVGSSFIPLGPANTVLNLAIAIAKAALIGFIFMHLRRSSVLVSLSVVTLVFWLAILFSLTFVDLLTR